MDTELRMLANLFSLAKSTMASSHESYKKKRNWRKNKILTEFWGDTHLFLTFTFYACQTLKIQPGVVG